MLSVSGVSITQGGFRLSNLSFEIPTGSYGVLMGRTGCGKTTVLEAICGLKPIQSGRIMLDDQRIESLPPGARRIGFVPQDGALFPTMTVRAQIAFGPTMQHWKRTAIRDKVESLAESLGIAALLERRPYGLSGGERQRVALARALAVEPSLLCLDEPLSALDEDTRAEICELLLELRQTLGFTALHVTHSRSEAERLGDTVLRLDNSRIATLD